MNNPTSFLIVSVCALLAIAAGIPYPRPVYTVRITPGLDLEQAVKDVPENSLAVITVAPGTYRIYTNLTSLFKNGVTWNCERGVKLEFGMIEDTEPLHIPFNDFSGAVTCNFLGFAEITYTNGSGDGAGLWMTNKDSLVRFECWSFSSGGQLATIHQEGGTLYYTAHDLTESSGYDAFYGGYYGTNYPKTLYRSRRTIGHAGDSAIETVACGRFGDQIFISDYMEGSINAVDNVLIRPGYVRLTGGSQIYGGPTNEISRHNVISVWFTNAPSSGDIFTNQSRLVTWTNNTAANSNFLQVGATAALSATALTNYAALYPFSNIVEVVKLNGTNVVFRSYNRPSGEGPMVFGASATSTNWMTVNTTNLSYPLGTGVIEDATIVAETNSVTYAAIRVPNDTFGTAFKLKRCTIEGPWLGDAIIAKPIAGNLTLEDCTVVCGPLSTNWVRPDPVGGNCNVRILGRFETAKTNASGITVIGRSYTTNAVVTY